MSEQRAASSEQGRGVRTYRDLLVWQKAIDLTEGVYKLTSHFSVDERYGLTAQMRRCAVSIPSNIAEGHGRQTRNAYLNHLRIARGSLRELETQLIIAGRVNLASGDRIATVLALCDEQGRMLHALTTKLEATP